MSRFSNLLSFVQADGHGRDDQQSTYERQVDAFMNAPVFTPAVYDFFRSGYESDESEESEELIELEESGESEESAYSSLSTSTASEIIPQYGLIGIRQDSADTDSSAEDRLVMANMNVPWSAFICGSQGAGKSHTLSCLLENGLVRDNPAGSLPHPLAGLILHYDKYASYNTVQICEAAYLCSSGIPVTVLVSPSNVWAMKALYSNLPGLKSKAKPKVLPLYLEEKQLDIAKILKLMAVDPTAQEVPLYMEVVMNLVREMVMEGPGAFTYAAFRERLSNISWVRGQEAPLKLRLQLLDTLMAPSSTTKTTRPAKAEENIWAFEPGSLTIVDLSDPFFSPEDACALFSICVSIFLEERNKCGRILALDEAHKFLTQAGEAKMLTDDLLSIIRQQRHTGTRVLIATQEPTLSPELIDLSNVTFVHRFLSPNWYGTLKKHLAGANKQDPGDANTLFDTIVALETGEALLFCPTAQMDVVGTNDGRGRVVKPLGNGYSKIKIRNRLTADGGKSMMATDASGEVPAQYEDLDVPMYRVQKPQSNNKRHENTAEPSASVATMSDDSGKSTLNGVQASSTAQAGQSASTDTPKVTTPSMGTFKTALRVQVLALYKEGSWTSFKKLTEAQRIRIFSGVDTALHLSPGTTAKNQDVMNLCHRRGLDDYIAAVQGKQNLKAELGAEQ
ncbi:hypothetical protein GGR54DRAFT_647332 [Hypoxylon sp. NC1633]|nr:hypothetical protein GGR54DRAFT_647332 [Hypoxylon sp. NC1633]